MKIKLIITLCLSFPIINTCYPANSVNIALLTPDTSAVSTPKQNSTVATAVATANNSIKSGSTAKMAKSYVLDVITNKSQDKKKVTRGADWFWVVISNPMTFMSNRPGDKKKIVLYANGIELKEFRSDLFSNITKENFKTIDTTIKIPFFLKRDSSTKTSWDNLYRIAGSWYKNQADVQLSVGWEDMLPLEVEPKATGKAEVRLVLFSNIVFISMIISYLVLLIGLGTLVLKTDILKELTGAYSLAQTQLAFWTILVLSGFIYSLLITGIPSTINTSILILLGISMGTNGVAKYIDYFIKERAKGTTPTVKKSTGSFWKDILGDASGINMQRFQIVAWNIVLGAYFTFFTFHNKTMPVIPDVLLTLAGISSLTYVVAKPTEP